MKPRLALVLAGLVLMTAGCSATPPLATQTPATAGQPFGPRTKSAQCVAHDGLPDSACTPGAVVSGVTAAQVCRVGYSGSVRNVSSDLKRNVYAEYGVSSRRAGDFEVDHLVPLELGGSNDVTNLWPQAAEPQPGFHEKDQVEHALHDQVCAGRMSLPDAQRAIATDWQQAPR